MKFAIEKNVPMPTKIGHGLVTDLRATMKDMKPGESFMILFNTTRPKLSVLNAFHNVKREMKGTKHFQSRTIKTGSPATDAVRVWCVELPKPK